jgi:hypothetical protein
MFAIWWVLFLVWRYAHKNDFMRRGLVSSILKTSCWVVVTSIGPFIRYLATLKQHIGKRVTVKCQEFFYTSHDSIVPLVHLLYLPFIVYLSVSYIFHAQIHSFIHYWIHHPVVDAYCSRMYKWQFLEELTGPYVLHTFLFVCRCQQGL